MPQEPIDNSTELEALALTSQKTNELLEEVDLNTEVAAQKLDDIETSTSATAVAVSQLNKPLTELNETSKEMVSVLRETKNVPERFQQFLNEFKGERGEPGIDGKDGERGSRFLGYFTTEEELQSLPDVKSGDFAIVGEKGTLWYTI